jgi:dinuclear metal center YbgI/SA1388 family protein
MSTVNNIISTLEEQFPLQWQESYDNSGLQLGSLKPRVSGILFALDCTEEIVEEAIAKQMNLLIVHHPIFFKGLKKISIDDSVGRIIKRCIENQVNVYAIHTNLDHHLQGVNGKIADKLRLTHRSVLSPKANTLVKLCVYSPKDAQAIVHRAVCDAGAGSIGNYYDCGFISEGIGTFTPNERANPTLGKAHEPTSLIESKMEYLVEKHHLPKVLSAMKKAHPYEEVAYEVVDLQNKNQSVGSGLIGMLPEAVEEKAFLHQLKETFGCGVIRHTALRNRPVQKVALCGGAGSFLLREAIRQDADVYISGDFKYHEFFEAENNIVIADIGHYESEQFTSELLKEFLAPRFTGVPMEVSSQTTNPVHYL